MNKVCLVIGAGAGIGGTAMPTWVGGLNDRQLWGIGLYLEDLIAKRGTAEGKALQKKLAEQPPWSPPPPPQEDEQPEDSAGDSNE